MPFRSAGRGRPAWHWDADELHIMRTIYDARPSAPTRHVAGLFGAPETVVQAWKREAGYTRPARPVTADEAATMCQLAREGKTHAYIASTVGRSIGTVSTVLRREGVSVMEARQ